MKLKSIHCYQYVRFDGKNQNFMTDNKQQGLEGLEIELLDGNIVSVKNSKDHILIFSTNIAYAVPMTEQTKKKGVESRGAITDIAPSSPKR